MPVRADSRASALVGEVRRGAWFGGSVQFPLETVPLGVAPEVQWSAAQT